MDIAQAIRDCYGVEGLVCEGQLHAVAGNLRHIALCTGGQHAAGEVAGHAPRAGLGELLSRHSRARRQVEDFLPRPQVQAFTGALTPGLILAKGQHRVSDVILGTDGVEHARNVEGLLIEICL